MCLSQKGMVIIMKNNGFIAIVIALGALLIVAGTLYEVLNYDTDPRTGLSVITEAEGMTDQTELEMAPDFTVYNSAGEAVKLSDYAGKPVVLNFWASWCPPCREEMPYFEELYTEMGDEVEFMMVNMTDNDRETVEVATKFMTDAGYTMPILFDTDTQAARAYTVIGVPMTMFVNAEGELVATARGSVTKDMLLEGITAIS